MQRNNRQYVFNKTVFGRPREPHLLADGSRVELVGGPGGNVVHELKHGRSCTKETMIEGGRCR